MNVRPRPVMMRWRWWLMAITAVLVVRRLKGPSSSPSRAIAEKLPPERSSASPQLPTAAEERESIFALARQFVGARHVQSLAGREACLRRAAETILTSTTTAECFVAAHRGDFLGTVEKESSSEPACERCGGRMQEASNYDEALGEWMPAWTCTRCGVQVPR